MTEEQVPQLAAELVRHQNAWRALHTDDAQWIIQNPKKAIALFVQSINQKKTLVEAIPTKVEIEERIVLHADLGEIVVPKKYASDSAIAKFHQDHHKSFSFYHENLKHTSFSSLSRIINSQRRFHARVYRSTISKITSVECLDFLEKKKAVYLGAYGLMLAWLLRKDTLAQVRRCVSFDRRENLLQDAHGARVPMMSPSPIDQWIFDFGFFDHLWDQGTTFLEFQEI